VNNSIGYEEWNLVSFCALDNFLKGRRTMQEYLQQCRRVTQYQDQLARQKAAQQAAQQQREQERGLGTTGQDPSQELDVSVPQP
jgi:hypothetical protein